MYTSLLISFVSLTSRAQRRIGQDNFHFCLFLVADSGNFGVRLPDKRHLTRAVLSKRCDR